MDDLARIISVDNPKMADIYELRTSHLGLHTPNIVAPFVWSTSCANVATMVPFSEVTRKINNPYKILIVPSNCVYPCLIEQ